MTEEPNEKLQVPAYVPKEVEEDLAAVLFGVEGRYEGYANILADIEAELASVEQQIEELIKTSTEGMLDGLRTKKLELMNRRDHYREEVACLKRLLLDPRMEEAYRALPLQINDPERWKAFIYSAWATRINYGTYRKRLKEVSELNQKIGKASAKLAGLLREIDGSSYSRWPPEFFSVADLLRKTDYKGSRSGNFKIWRGLRHLITGDRLDYSVEPKKHKTVEFPDSLKTTIVGVEPGDKIAKREPEEQLRDSISYAWEVSPCLADLLDTVSGASRNFKPSEMGPIGAALKSRQTSRGQNKEYLRGWAYSLNDIHGFEISSELKKLMALVATVVINDTDIDVIYDDVVKAIEVL